MAIAFDAAANGSATSNTVTFSHTVGVAANRILFVGAFATGGPPVVTGVTYNGVVMTKIASNNPQANDELSLWYLLAPASGTHDVVIMASTGFFTKGVAASYSDSVQVGIPDALVKAIGSVAASTFGLPLTTIADDCWVVAVGKTGASTIAAGAGSTSRTEIDSASASIILADNNATVTPPGIVNMAFTSGAADSWGLIMVSFQSLHVIVTVPLETLSMSAVPLNPLVAGGIVPPNILNPAKPTTVLSNQAKPT
jgi:hypothetical protein